MVKVVFEPSPLNVCTTCASPVKLAPVNAPTPTSSCSASSAAFTCLVPETEFNALLPKTLTTFSEFAYDR